MKSFCIMILLFGYFLAGAQVDIGIKSGISIPNLDGVMKLSKFPASGIGMYGGLVMAIRVAPSIYIQTELNFSKQGGQRTGIQEAPANIMNDLVLSKEAKIYADYKNKTVLNYMEIPILAKYLLGKKVKYYACLGPYIAFLVKATNTTSGSSLLYVDAYGKVPLTQSNSPYPIVSLNNTANSKESIKTINLGVQGGIGVQFPVRAGNIFLEGRTILGVSNIQAHTTRDGKNETNSFIAAAGYLFKIK